MAKKTPLDAQRKRAAFAAATRRQLRNMGHDVDNARIISDAISAAAQEGTKLRIKYVAKYNERPLTHVISPYELKTKGRRGPYLYADDHSGRTRGIHSFLAFRILSATPLQVKSAGEWPNKIARKKTVRITY